MDFVVVGLGLGALGVLLGVVMLGWLAPRAQRAAARTASPDDAVRDLAVAAEHRGTGQAFLYAGVAMLLATTGGLAGALDDRTGALLVTTTATVAAVGILLGGYLHRLRNPLPRRRGPAPAVETSPLAVEGSVNVSRLLTDVAASGAADLPQVSRVDNGVARFDRFPAASAGVAATVPEDTMPSVRANGGYAFGDVELDRMGDVPVAPSRDPESGLIIDLSDDSEDADPAQEEEVVVVGYVVPATGSADSPSPPSPRDAGEDPS